MSPKPVQQRSTPAVKTDGTVKAARTKNAVLSRGFKVGLDQINTILKEQPHKIPHCLLMLQGDMFDMQQTNVQTAKERQMNVDEPWPKTYSTVDMIPRFWLCAFLQKVNLAFTDSVFQVLHKAAPLPPACRQKLVCSRWFEHLYVVHGRRCDGQWVSEFVGSDGAIDWLRGGVFLVAQDGERPAFAIKHLEVQTPVMLPLVLAPGTAVKDNHSDSLAEIDDGLGIKCIKFFKDVGAKLLERDQKSTRSELANTIQAGMSNAALEANASQVVVAESVMALFKQAPPSQAPKALADSSRAPALCDDEAP